MTQHTEKIDYNYVIFFKHGPTCPASFVTQFSPHNVVACRKLKGNVQLAMSFASRAVLHALGGPTRLILLGRASYSTKEAWLNCGFSNLSRILYVDIVASADT